MPYWTKMDRFKITARSKDGAIKSTKMVQSEWFNNAEAPKPYIEDQDGYFWANTTDMHFGPTKPEEAMEH